MKYMIGVDLGTTSTKVVLFDLKGKSIAYAANNVTTIQPHFGK
ncbi:FGGY family carbohydrate kinase [Pediococcus acidilactici]